MVKRTVSVRNRCIHVRRMLRAGQSSQSTGQGVGEDGGSTDGRACSAERDEASTEADADTSGRDAGTSEGGAGSWERDGGSSKGGTDASGKDEASTEAD